MENAMCLLIKLFAVFLGFVAITSFAFVWLLPDVPHWSRSYFTFSIGPICAALLGGYITFQSAPISSLSNKMLLASFSAVVLGLCVAITVLFIIVNLKGS